MSDAEDLQRILDPGPQGGPTYAEASRAAAGGYPFPAWLAGVRAELEQMLPPGLAFLDGPAVEVGPARHFQLDRPAATWAGPRRRVVCPETGEVNHLPVSWADRVDGGAP